MDEDAAGGLGWESAKERVLRREESEIFLFDAPTAGWLSF
jgi:hypothetical protein